MNGTDLAQERERWRAIINAVMDLRVLSNGGGERFLDKLRNC
jgi:hypothetical protein